jgi:hypothetical protein
MGAVYIYEPVTFDFVNQSSVTVTHSFGRPVNVQVEDVYGSVIMADVYKNDITATAKFYRRSSPYLFSGKVVVS